MAVPLSVVIPILNESLLLPQLFAMLGEQQGIDFELVLVDGGSTDGSKALADELAALASFPCRIVGAQRGRGRQFNVGVQHSVGEFLLFLHADSQFLDHSALAKALNHLKQAIFQAGHARIAGHFSLRFQQLSSNPSLGDYYLECKARLGRVGTVYGDQGCLLRRCFFDQVGPFEETLGFLEDYYLAQSIHQVGHWLLLPIDLLTSSRRFAQEGFRERQTLNALIMNLAAVDQIDLLKIIPGLYRQQSRTEKLTLTPFFQELASHLAMQTSNKRRLFWYRSGQYLIANAWQLAFWLDVRRAFRQNREPGTGSRACLRFFDRSLFLLNHPVGYVVAGQALRLWFWGHWCRR